MWLRWKTRLLVACSCGVFLGVLGAAMPTLINSVIGSEVAAQFNLEEGSESSAEFFKMWENPSDEGIEIYVQAMLWNLTNPAEVAEGAPPDLQLVGPWTYLEDRQKFDFEYVDDGEILKYKVNKTYAYVDNPCKAPLLPFTAMCSMPEDMVLTTLNIPLIGIVKQLKALNNSQLERTLLRTLQLFLPQGQNDGL